MDIAILAILLTVAGTVITLVIGIWQIYLAKMQLKQGGGREAQSPQELALIPKPKPPRKRAFRFVDRFDRRGKLLTKSTIEALAQGGIISLWGSGGVGKTTIAIEVAHEIADSLDGVIWIGLETYDDFSLSGILNETCIQMKREDALTLSFDARRALVKSLLSDGEYLLIVDNFEIIRDKEEIISFLRELPCKVLITTRQVLPNCHNIEVLPMNNPEAESLVQYLIEESSDRRWLRHANIREVVRVAEGNPLLLQWVVGQLQLAVYPEKVFSDLAGGKGEAVDRVFGRSFILLSEEAQRILLSLSLFRGGASNRSLAQICEIAGDPLVDNYLSELRHLRLIKHATSEKVSLTGLIRNLSSIRLQTDGRGKKIKTNFTTYYLNYSEATPNEHSELFANLEAERENLIAAMELAYQLASWQTVLRFWKSISLFLWKRGYWDEYVACDHLALDSAEKVGDRETTAIVLSEIGWVLIDRADYEKAIKYVQQAYGIFTELENQPWCATTLTYLGIAKYRDNNLDEAEDYYKKAMAIAEREKFVERIGVLKNYLGSLYRKRGDYKRARQQYDESLATLEASNDVERLMGTLRNLGALEFHEGNLRESRVYFNRGLIIANKDLKKDMIAGFNYQLAKLEKEEGNLPDALKLAVLAESDYRELKMGRDRNLAQELIDEIKQSMRK